MRLRYYTGPCAAAQITTELRDCGLTALEGTEHVHVTLTPGPHCPVTLEDAHTFIAKLFEQTNRKRFWPSNPERLPFRR